MKIRKIIGFAFASTFLLGSISLSVAAKEEKPYVPTFATYTNHDAATYYNGIDLEGSGTTLLTALQNLNKTKRKSTVGYSSMGTSPSGQFKYTDYDPATVKYDSNNQPYGTKISSFYTYTSATSWNREHVWPNSHGGGSNGSLSSPYIDADIHMPRPTITEENSSRGNSFFVEGKNHSSNGWDPKTAGYNENSRGEAARITLYCVVADPRLELVASDKTSTPDNKMGNLETLLKWTMQYDVTDREKNRNEGAEYLQGNRNPFIDHPELGCRIWGKTNAKTREICAGYLDDETPVAVQGVSFKETSLEVPVGKTASLTPVFTPTNASNKKLTWTSSNTSVATVSNGEITGVALGKSTITATTVDGGFKAELEISVVPVPTFTITFNTDGGSSIAAQQVEYGDTIKKPTNPTKENYTFAGWYLGSEAFDFNTIVTSNLTLTAHWLEKGSNHGQSEGDPLSPTEAIALCQQAGDGNIVGGNVIYYVKGVFDNSTTVNKDYHQWYGSLSGTEFKVSGATNDSGVSVEENDGAMNGKEVVIKGYIELYQGVYKIGYLPASASPTGQKYVPSIISIIGGGSGGDQPGGDTPTPTPTKYTVAFNSDGGTSVSSQQVESGSKAQKPADPTKEGYTFAGWYLGNNLYNFDSAVTSSINLVAHWTPNDPSGQDTPNVYTVAFNSDGGTSVSSQQVESGSKAQKPADPTKEGYTFAGWYLDSTVYDFETPVTGSITLMAHWTKNTTPDTPDTPVDPGDEDKTLVSISITPPTKKDYKVGEKMDWTGFKVIAKYDDGSFLDVTDVATISNVDLSRAGEVIVSVAYVEGDIIKTGGFIITVTGKANSKGAGCGGSIIATSAVISLTSLMGLGLLIIKKKKHF